jgi:hypothetical protein
MLLSGLLLSITQIIGCSGGVNLHTSTVNIQGSVKNIFNNELPTKITLQVVGRNDLSADASLANVSSSGFSFSLDNVPDGDTVVFSVGGVPLQTVLSLPQIASKAGNTVLGFIGINNFESLKTIATQQGTSQGLVIDANKGIILGVVSESQRLSVTTVELLINVNQQASVNGPFYFNAESNSPIGYKLANSFDSSNGIYVFFNVPEGNYVLRFSGNNGVSAKNVSVPAAGVVIAQDVP